MTLSATKPQEWTRDGFVISTDPTLISHSALNEAFSSDALPWAKALSSSELSTLISNSVCFGLYAATVPAESTTTTETTTDPDPDAAPAMIGLARLISDRTTFAYLTDVYVHPSWQKRGLGTWLVRCVKEWWDALPSGRRMLFITSEGVKEEYYARELNAGRMEDEGNGYRVFAVRGGSTVV